ncbi:MAG TPA: hypothetical protein VH740_03945 [Vicinamibacterales bacterium]|jgi:hypothetical protein
MAAAFAVGLAAQTTPPQSTPPSQPPASQSQPAMADRDAAKTVTVTGCLKAGDTADSFMLSDLKWSSRDSKGTGAVGTSGSAGAPPAGLGTVTSLKIVPSASTKLSEHVGHQVEVSGTISDKDKDRGAAPSAPPDPASASARSSSSSGPALEVRTVKMIAATCSQ